MTGRAGFDWSGGNVEKLWREHGLTTEEAEEAFGDPDRVRHPEYPGPGGELRRVVAGRTEDGLLLVVVYARRQGMIRVVTAYPGNAADARAYERNRRRRGPRRPRR